MIKELRNEERMEKKGSKYLYTQERVVEMDHNDILSVATRSKQKIAEIKQSFDAMKAEKKRAETFLQQNAKTIKAAEEEAAKQFCEKCGMNFADKENKNMRSMKVSSIYKVLCKNCAKEVHD